MFNDDLFLDYMDGEGFVQTCDIVSEVTAVILAGGLGTRLRTVIGNSQKVMANVGSKPFLEHILNQVSEAGISNAVLCTGFMSEQVQDHFGEKYGEINLKYSVEHLLLGTGGALRFAMSQVQSDPFLVMNGDSHCDANLEEFFEAHVKNKANVSLMLVEVPDTQRYGRVDFNDKFQITNFEEKGAVKGKGWINAGIYLVSKSVISELPKGHNVSLERDIFPALIGKGFYAHCSKAAKFVDIGVPESYETANKEYSGK